VLGYFEFRRLTMRRRALATIFGAAALGALLPPGRTRAEDRTITIGITLPLTGSGAEDAVNILHGAMLAIEQANEAGGISGHQIQVQTLDNGTATAGQYDPAQAAVNARKLVSDKSVVGVIGPMNSGSGKAQSAIYSQANLATITPSSTNPDLSDPKFAGIYRPAGLPIYFRTVTTDAFQGPNMANYMADTLKVKSVFDSGAYGVGLADAFAAQASKRGIAVLGRDRVDPLASDYTALLTRIKGLNPQALYCGSSALAGIKLVKQSYDIMPNMLKAGGDGLHQASILSGAGFPASEGWYSTIAAPHMLDDKILQPWIESYVKRWGNQPADYALTAYDAALVLLAAIKSVAESGKPINRVAVRDAIQAGHVSTLQGEITFDGNGDMTSRVVSVFQVRYDPKYPANDVIHQFKFVGIAPTIE
jgi:branched-chain amino acid transport system substrate-binding protein